MTPALTSPPFTVLSREAWEKLDRLALGEADSGTVPTPAPTDVILRKEAAGSVIRAYGDDDDEDRRTLDFTISTSSVDRDRDVIEAAGWKLEQYRQNPVVLWAHDYREHPIARATNLRVEGDALKATAEFTPKELNAFGYATYQLLRAGFLNATSVGFRPIKWSINEDRRGYDFMEQELLEFSIVPVPANAEALIGARAAGIDLTPLKRWAEQVLDAYSPSDKGGVWLPRHLVERAYFPSADGLTYFLIDGSPTEEPQLLAGVEADESTIADRLLDKGVSPGDVSTDLADRGDSWSAPSLSDFTSESWESLSSTEKRRIARHYAWADAMPPSSFTDGLKLPHHRASDGKVVWRGVANAAARMNQMSGVPSGDMADIRRHLGRHYRAFGETPPWDRESLERVSETLSTVAERLVEINDKLATIIHNASDTTSHARADPVADDQAALSDDTVFEVDDSPDEESVEFEGDVDDLKALVREAMGDVSRRIDDRLMAVTGRLPS